MKINTTWLFLLIYIGFISYWSDFLYEFFDYGDYKIFIFSFSALGIGISLYFGNDLYSKINGIFYLLLSIFFLENFFEDFLFVFLNISWFTFLLRFISLAVFFLILAMKSFFSFKLSLNVIKWFYYMILFMFIIQVIAYLLTYTFMDNIIEKFIDFTLDGLMHFSPTVLIYFSSIKLLNFKSILKPFGIISILWLFLFGFANLLNFFPFDSPIDLLRIYSVFVFILYLEPTLFSLSLKFILNFLMMLLSIILFSTFDNYYFELIVIISLTLPSIFLLLNDNFILIGEKRLFFLSIISLILLIGTSLGNYLFDYFYYGFLPTNNHGISAFLIYFTHYFMIFSLPLFLFLNYKFFLKLKS